MKEKFCRKYKLLLKKTQPANYRFKKKKQWNKEKLHFTYLFMYLKPNITNKQNMLIVLQLNLKNCVLSKIIVFVGLSWQETVFVMLF